jgi:predicted nucleic acid-binding protein
MLQVALDTSFLISFASPGRPHHAASVDYFRLCLARRIPMWVSTIAAGEFEVGQPVSDLPLQNFRILPYNLPHAIKAAELFKANRALNPPKTPEDKRPLVINDLKIIAQCEAERISVVLTEDENTLVRIARRLREARHTQTRVLLLRDGFTPGALAAPDQGEFPLSTPQT